jgi:AraC-like DNA-binding protein
MSAPNPHVLLGARFAESRDCPWHVHQGHELVLVTAGSCRITCGATELAGDVGTLFVLPRGEPQYQRGSVQTSYIIWQAGEEVLVPTPRTFQLTPNDRERRWIEECCDLSLSGADARITDAVFLALLRALASRMGIQATHATMHPGLVRAGEYITEHLTVTLDVDALAQQTGMSTSHLNRLFRSHHGCGPLRYQQDLRLQLAQRFLQDPMLTVTEVAKRCGYPDANYFVRLFRQRCGRPPAAWRGTRH